MTQHKNEDLPSASSCLLPKFPRRPWHAEGPLMNDMWARDDLGTQVRGTIIVKDISGRVHVFFHVLFM